MRRRGGACTDEAVHMRRRGGACADKAVHMDDGAVHLGGGDACGRRGGSYKDGWSVDAWSGQKAVQMWAQAVCLSVSSANARSRKPLSSLIYTNNTINPSNGLADIQKRVLDLFSEPGKDPDSSSYWHFFALKGHKMA